ncbi:hypothetical protein LL127_19315 [Clostridium estertheticum]|uniref:hypothetical protein n=1 Tax=Clostridium estertheticum TaxID=238834 RepID=UPI001CF4BAF8|nr:hypothetical protein [Clostridium estertheticum]MCB2305641.1 hypothetical protein [Clostridium estertheticum]WAG45641.1 hypothetical protein LL127_19315 [Clostridium estertheticum]
MEFLERLKNIVINFNDISEGKSPNYIRKLHTITNRKLKYNSKSPSEVVNISATQEMI